MSAPANLYDAAPIKVRRIVEAVAIAHKLDPLDIMSGCSSHRAVRARWDAFSRLRSMPYGGGRPSLPQIASWFGMHHTSVLHGLRAMQQEIAA